MPEQSGLPARQGQAAEPHITNPGTGRKSIVKLLRLPEVMELVRLGKSTIYEMVKQKRFPAPLKQGGGNFWIDAEIDAYLQHLISERSTTINN
jgi:prophage regulatory protein